MRILIAVHHFPPNRIAGAELRALRLARWLLAHGHKVRVVCVEDIVPDTTDGLEWRDDVYERIPVKRITFHRSRGSGLTQRDYDWPRLTDLLDEVVALWRPELIHLISGYLMGMAPLRAAWAHNVPIVVTLVDFWFLCPTIQLLRYDGSLCCGPQPDDCLRCLYSLGGAWRWFQDHFDLVNDVLMRMVCSPMSPACIREQRRQLEKRRNLLLASLSKVDAVICVTRSMADLYRTHGLPEELVHVIGYRPRSAIASNDVAVDEIIGKSSSTPVHFGYIGAVWPHKGVHVLVEAFRKVRDPRARLTIMGLIDSPAYERRLRKASRGDARIVFTGPYRNSDLSRLVADIDVIVVPSIWHENAPRTLVEAFDLKKPVIGSAVGGIQELVQDGVNGMLYAHDDPDALADCLGRFVSNPGLIAKYREAIPELQLGDVENERVWQVYEQVMVANR